MRLAASSIAPALALLALSGCQRTVPVAPEGTSTALVGVVIAGADSAFIALGRSAGEERLSPEPGARLELSGPGFRRALVEAPGGGDACGRAVPAFSCYRAELGGVVAPGDIVRLEGELASGQAVSGEAVVPPVPGITVEGAGPGDTVRAGPLDDARREVLGLGDEPFRVSAADTVATATVWAADGEARTCRVRLPGPFPRENLSRRPFQVFVSVREPDCPGAPGLAWDSMAVPLTLLGYDRNFTEWAGRFGFDGTGGGGVGVTGVEGVFGAATPRTFVMIVTP